MLQDNTFTVYPNPVIDLDNMDTTFAAGESLVIKVTLEAGVSKAISIITSLRVFNFWVWQLYVI